ncbi:MAG: diphthamide synthesis protein [Nanoarchaeota archaeon]|nr:diphthamide synthesis protein [Nanoarchaeota archaeon]
MQTKTMQEFEKEYELELDKIVLEINKQKPAKVLLQLPDGFKPFATTIAEYLEKETNANVVIWFGSCYGACDVPKTDAELVIQFGHSPWSKQD